MYQGGYTGKILRFNPTDQTANEAELAPKIAKDFIGDPGFGIKDFFDELKAGKDPLDPNHKLSFSFGPFFGATIPCASRIAVTVKSPLTDVVDVALPGGYFPCEKSSRNWVLNRPLIPELLSGKTLQT